MATTFDVTKHVIVPKHEICSQAEQKRVLSAHGIEAKDMPRILESDAGIQHLGAKKGDIIKISRTSPTAGDTVFYRVVVTE